MIDDELKKHAPRLHELRQEKDGFQIPEGYFNTLEDRVFDHIEVAGLHRQIPLKIQQRKARRFSLPQMAMAVAAVFTLVLSAVWFFASPNQNVPQLTSVELSEEDIETYVLENVQDFEAEQLAVLPQEDENEYQAPTQPKSPKGKDPLEDITPEDVEHILNEMTEEELEEIL